MFQEKPIFPHLQGSRIQEVSLPLWILDPLLLGFSILEDGTKGCYEMSGINHHYSRNNAEQCNSHLHCSRSLKSHILVHHFPVSNRCSQKPLSEFMATLLVAFSELLRNVHRNCRFDCRFDLQYSNKWPGSFTIMALYKASWSKM